MEILKGTVFCILDFRRGLGYISGGFVYLVYSTVVIVYGFNKKERV